MLKLWPDGLLREDIHGQRQMVVDNEYVVPMKAVNDGMSIIMVFSSMNLDRGWRRA